MGRDVNRHSGADEETLVCPDDGCCGIVSVLNVVDGCECMYVQYIGFEYPRIKRAYFAVKLMSPLSSLPSRSLGLNGSSHASQ